MRSLVDALTADLSAQYSEQLQALLIDLRLDEGRAELWVRFSLRSDQILRQLTLPVAADAGQQDARIREVFQEVETFIESARAAERHSAI